MVIDRIDAGKQLAKKIVHDQLKCPLVMALPRGGVVVGYPIAQALDVPMEIVIARKLGIPENPEFGIGAIAEGGIVFWNSGMVNILQIARSELQLIRERQLQELERRIKLYRNDKPLPLLTNKTIILVDDGLATGVTAHAALLSIKKQHPKQVIFAVPVCSKETAHFIEPLVARIICLESQEHLEAVGSFYHDFRQVTDKEVLRILQKTRRNLRKTKMEERDFNFNIIW